MRNAFADEVTKLAAEDERVVLLSGDIGNRLFDTYKGRFPDRFYNCGVAEANMTGVAAGLGLSGLRPITYTITPFNTTRCLEQIRVDVCYHHVPVTIVGVGGGLSYAELGATHHSCEDIGFLRLLPGMTVVCPGDPVEVRLALRAALQHDGPVYIRIGKRGEPVIHQEPPPFALGRSITLRQGQDVCLLSTGNMLPTVVETADALAKGRVAARVESFHTVKPLDEATLDEVFSSYPVVVVVEEHSRLGGLGGAIAEWLARQPAAQKPRARLLSIGTADAFFHEAGDEHHARRHFGLTPEAITRDTLAALEGARTVTRSAVLA